MIVGRKSRLWISKHGRTVALFLLSALLVAGRATAYQKTDHGIQLQVGDARVELAVATAKAFRLSISFDGKITPIESSFLVKPTAPEWQLVQSETHVGIKTSFGELDINPTSGKWTLMDARGATLIPSSGPGDLRTANSNDKSNAPGIDLTVAGKPGASLEVYGCGNGAPTLLQTKAETRVGNGTAVIPYYWTPTGYAAFGVTEDDNAPASWTTDPDHSSLTWHFPGKTADLYLMPAPSLYDAARAYGQLTGLAPVPPRWCFGYMQSRWGWTDRAYIEETLHQFVQRHIPVDAFIYDFEWYTPHPDYEVPPQGEAGFSDFGWNAKTFF